MLALPPPRYPRRTFVRGGRKQMTKQSGEYSATQPVKAFSYLKTVVYATVLTNESAV